MTVNGRRVIQLVLVEPDRAGACTSSVHEFAQLLGGGSSSHIREFASIVDTPGGFTEMDVLRKFFYSPGDAHGTKPPRQQYEETAAILGAAFATVDSRRLEPTGPCYSPRDPTEPCYSPVSEPRADDMTVYVAKVDRGSVDALRDALDYADYDVEVEFVRGIRVRITLRRMVYAGSAVSLECDLGTVGGDLGSVGNVLSRYGTGTIHYDEEATHRVVPLLVREAQHDTRTWRRFVRAVHGAARVDSDHDIDDPVARMLVALALSASPENAPQAPQAAAFSCGEPSCGMMPDEEHHHTFVLPVRASPYSPCGSRGDAGSLLALTAYKLNLHFERVMRHRPVAAHLKVKRARRGRLSVSIPAYTPPGATTDPGHFYGPYTVVIDPRDLVVPA